MSGGNIVTYIHSKNYFDFEGKRYGVGTVVKIKPGGMYTSQREIARCNGVAVFEWGNDHGWLSFQGVVAVGTSRCGLTIYGNPEDSIVEIIKPVYYENKPAWQVAIDNYSKTPPARRADIAPGTIVYVAVMLVGSIFKGNWVIWIIATFFYLKYLVDIYRD